MSTLQVAEALAGDERAFRAVVGPYRRALEVHCYRMLGSIHDAEDVVQDTLLRAWRSFGRFERPLVGGDLAVPDRDQRVPGRAREAAAARVEPYPDSRLEDADTSIADPAARYALHEGMELAFLTAIQRLPGRQRAILILRDVLGWTAAEAADLLDTTVTAVNSALQRARATIEAEAPAHRVAARPRLPARAAAPLRRRVGAGRHGRAARAAARGRRDDDAARRPTVVGAAAIVAFFGAQCGGAVAASATWVNGAPAVDLRERDGCAAPPARPRRRRRARRRDRRGLTRPLNAETRI